MSDENHFLSGRVAVVTGSSSGIGKAIALELARNGASVVVHGRTKSSRLEETQQLIVDQGGQATATWADLADTDHLPRLVNHAWNWRDHVDIWINNAGADVLTGELAGRDFVEKLDLVWKVDVRATLLLSRSVGARMCKQDALRKGKFVILNMGWDQAAQGMAGDSGELFAATKGAIMSFTKSLALSLAPQVRVNCLAPGWIKTKWGESVNEEWEQRAISESLMNRWGTPEDVARVAAFLSSDQADFISGQVVPINGGFRHGR
jgi:3-oxoacyl-[acyl-carrier protein] reductase